MHISSQSAFRVQCYCSNTTCPERDKLQAVEEEDLVKYFQMPDESGVIRNKRLMK
jgi:hypothetical protein